MAQTLTRYPVTAWVVSALVLLLAIVIGQARARQQTGKITWETRRTAVDLAFVIEKDDDGNVSKIHRFILWSNGDVTFPNIPYYAKLVFSCRDCPRPYTYCPGDIDGDGVVGVPDLLIGLAAWGNCAASP